MNTLKKTNTLCEHCNFPLYLTTLNKRLFCKKCRVYSQRQEPRYLNSCLINILEFKKS